MSSVVPKPRMRRAFLNVFFASETLAFGSEGIGPGLFTDVRVEEWTYNFGPRKLMRLIRLENGVVADIQELGYGFRE